MAQPMHVTAIIPALDEEGAIGETVLRLDRTLVQDIIVVDNGSRDRTAERAAAAGARIHCRRRVGRSKVAGTLRGSLLSGYHFLVTVFRYAWGPLR